MIRILFVLFSILLHVGLAQASLSGAVRGRLTSANSPYTVTGDLIVNDFDTLRIDAGVEMRFNENVTFRIYGRIKVAGTVEDSVRFLPNQTPVQPGFWSGIHLDGADNSSFLDFVHISGAAVGVTISQCSPTVKNTAFQNNLTAIDCKSNSSAVIQNNLFKENINAGVRIIQSTPEIKNCRFYSNCESGVESVIVFNNKSSGTVLQNIIAYNYASAIDISDSSLPNIFHNTIVENQYGISVQNANPNIRNNIIFQNQNGLVMENYNGNVCFNDVFGNTVQDFYGEPAGVGVLVSVNANADSVDQFGNLQLNPQLPGITDYHFEPQSSSPVLDAGDPDNPGNIDFLGVAPDMGAIETEKALPVELLFFRYANECLEWMTASEKNNYGFRIWRSINSEMKNAVQIGFVKGNGTTNQPHFYSFSDPNPLKQNCYYQLEQIDTNGNSEFSAVVQVQSTSKINTPEVYSPYPNPFNAEIQFGWYMPIKAPVSLRIYNVLGKEVVTLFYSASLPSGDYTVVWGGVNDQGMKISSGCYYGILKIGRYNYKIPVLLVQ